MLHFNTKKTSLRVEVDCIKKPNPHKAGEVLREYLIMNNIRNKQVT